MTHVEPDQAGHFNSVIPPIADAHHHLWDMRHYHVWLHADPPVVNFVGDYESICEDYLAADYVADTAGLPVIASVHGYALAGALELMMCCDLAIAADTAKFGEPEVRHNSGPPSLMMPWLLSSRDTRWLMFTGDLVDAAQAREMRLINKVVPADQLALETDKLARKMARMPVPALKYTKASLNNQQMVAGLLSSFQYNIEAIAALHSTKQGRDWMRNLATMSLKEYLNFRDSPFAGLD